MRERALAGQSYPCLENIVRTTYDEIWISDGYQADVVCTQWIRLTLVLRYSRRPHRRRNDHCDPVPRGSQLRLEGLNWLDIELQSRCRL